MSFGVKSFRLITITGALCLGLALCVPAEAAPLPLESQVNAGFRSVFDGRNPNGEENRYWLGRVVRKEKKTFEELRGAMFYAKALGKTVGTTTAKASASTKVSADKSVDKAGLIVDVLPLFEKYVGNNPTNTEKAWWRKRISCGEIKTRDALIRSMAFHKSKGVRKGKDTICGQTAPAAQSGVVGKGLSGIGGHVMGDQVRIGIFKTDGRAIHVTADGGFQVREGNTIKATLGKDDVVQVSWSDGKYHVRGSGLELDLEGVVRIVPLNQAIVQIKSYSDPSASIPGKNYNRFRGIVEIRKCSSCNELWAINELRTEYYLRGLGETSGTGPEEFIKALGIAARTYVLYHKVVTGGRNPARGYDIGSTADDQIYRGYEYESITPRMASIFNAVKGIIVADAEGDKPVSTVYFSDSDGRTRSAKEAWKTDRFPHLQHSVDDPHHVAKACNGHCVGMSAQGAYGFANKDGWSWQKILSYYYKGVKFVKAY